MVLGISMVRLFVSNLDESVQFYRDGLGLSLDETWEKRALFELDDVSLVLVALERFSERDGRRAGPSRDVTLSHVVDSPATVDEVLSKAETAGATIVALGADKRWGGYGGHFTDPDGYRWEVLSAPDTSDSERPSVNRIVANTR